MSDKIILNVGGTKYETYRTTLTAYPETFLGNVFIHGILEPTNENEYFLDRDGQLFRYILQYYRNEGKIYCPNSELREELKDEFKYFQIKTDNNDLFNESTSLESERERERERENSQGQEICLIDAFDQVIRDMSNMGTPTYVRFGQVIRDMKLPSVQIRFGNGYIAIEPKNPSYEELFEPFKNTGLAMIRQSSSVIQGKFFTKYPNVSWDNLQNDPFSNFWGNQNNLSEFTILLMKRR